MEWFRFYDEVLDDPKVQRLPAQLFREWINILCIANRNDPRGTLPGIDDVAFSLRVSGAKCQATYKALTEAGLLIEVDGVMAPKGWDKRQRVSDNVAERVAKHRARNVTSNDTCNVTPPVTGNTPKTLPHARATDTETETDTEQKTTTTPKPKTAKAKPTADTAPNGTAVVDHPFALFEAMCEQTGIDPEAVPARDKGKQLAVAKRLVESGTSSGDVKSITKWLKSQSWRTGGVDLFIVEKEQMRWLSEGKPDGSSPDARRKPPANLQTNKERNDKSVWVADWPESTG